MKGAAGRQLMTKRDFRYLGEFPQAMRVLVVAGSLGFNPFIRGQNDGTVAVSETFLSTPHSHCIVRRGHKNILFSQAVSAITKAFLDE